MTGLTNIIAFRPTPIAMSARAAVQRPLATVLIGGLVTSLLLTLLVLPGIYRWFAPGKHATEEGAFACG